ncbi:Histone deacetylase complex subunit SAP30L-A [Tetrabaena socialis]|uniref:Histone deacetylase complex subunit SAP30L-A n=1 Tax=Tetrabaena socialis TaxID=47790 RepID=A0A2J7ZX92_9CHLO|nr:Histone deacetylase complex subunit SAP30L-A [Tetrabaena socialis]|eukprot:PNH04889.1 Histone deacetylase complex subunit SAP30L-A [Tetrabaena socialis]
MADRRPTRPSAARAKDHFTAQSESDDEGGRPTRSSRRITRVDLSKLDVASLHRYRKCYKLGDAPATATKEELLPSVSRHFAHQVVDEEEVLLKFVLSVQRHNQQQQQQRVYNAMLLKQHQQQQHQVVQHQLQQQLQYRAFQQVGQGQQPNHISHIKGGVMKPRR